MPNRQSKIKQARQEMWWVILAKSKTLRFFAVSCEFILFLGGLWITFTVNDPSSKTWLGGNINMIFLTVMGWAVDAAMPEAWLHVVIQHVQKEHGQLGWSKFVAICISLLFIGNIVYSVFTGGDKTGGVSGTPTDATGWILLILVILRITVGFVYITVRQCQEWIKRQNPEATPPALHTDDWAMVGLMAHLQQEIQQAVSGLQASFNQQLAELASKQQQALNDLSASIPTIDYDALTQVVLTRLQAEFDARQKAQMVAVQEEMTHQIDAPKPRQKRVSAPKNDASTKILTMRHPSASKTDKKERIHALLDEDENLSSYRLATLVGCSEPTARRIKNEYIDMRHDACDASKNDASEQEILTHDALRQNA